MASNEELVQCTGSNVCADDTCTHRDPHEKSDCSEHPTRCKTIGRDVVCLHMRPLFAKSEDANDHTLEYRFEMTASGWFRIGLQVTQNNIIWSQYTSYDSIAVINYNGIHFRGVTDYHAGYFPTNCVFVVEPHKTDLLTTAEEPVFNTLPKDVKPENLPG